MLTYIVLFWPGAEYGLTLLCKCRIYLCCGTVSADVDKPACYILFGYIMLNEISVDLEIFSRIVILFVVKIASDAGH